MKSDKSCLRFSRPRMRCFAVIDHGQRIRKLLQRYYRRRGGKTTSGNDRDAIRTVELMIALARFGLRADAADAIVVADHLDTLSQVVDKHVDAILATVGQVRER